MKLWAPDYLPLDEDILRTRRIPTDFLKCSGKIADSIVSVHKDMTISSLRFPGVNFDLSYESFRERWRNPSSRANGFGRISTRATRRRLVGWRWKRNSPAMRVFIASAPNNCMIQPTTRAGEKYLPKGAKIKRSPVRIGAASIRPKRGACSDSSRNMSGRISSKKTKLG